MKATLGELAKLIDGKLSGDPELLITGAATIRDATSNDITLADKPQLSEKLKHSRAAAVVVNGSFVPENVPYISVKNVHAAFAKVVARFRPDRLSPARQISSQAIISPSAQFGENVSVNPAAIVGDDVRLGDNCVIHCGVVLMEGCQIGDDVQIFPNAVLYQNTCVGNRCIIHAGAVLGAFGFGYESSSGQHILSSQLGNVLLEDDVEVGANTTIDRGTYGSTKIGAGTKIDNLVMIGHNCSIGKHNLICSMVGIAGSCSTGDYVVMAGQAGVGDHADLGDQVVIGAQAGVMSNAKILEKGVYFGSPINPVREQMRQHAALKKLPEVLREFRQLQQQIEELKTTVSQQDGKSAA